MLLNLPNGATGYGFIVERFDVADGWGRYAEELSGRHFFRG